MGSTTLQDLLHYLGGARALLPLLLLLQRPPPPEPVAEHGAPGEPTAALKGELLAGEAASNEPCSKEVFSRRLPKSRCLLTLAADLAGPTDVPNLAAEVVLALAVMLESGVGSQESLRQTAVFPALGDLLRQALPCYLTPALVAAEAEVTPPPSLITSRSFMSSTHRT